MQQPTTNAGVPMVGQQDPHQINIDPFEVVLAVTNKAQNVEAFPVPAGATVRVKASNGTNLGNANPIHVALNQAAAETGPYRIVEPKYEITFPVENTCQIWIAGTAGDGAIVTIAGR